MCIQFSLCVHFKFAGHPFEGISVLLKLNLAGTSA